jgi:hypothetical protein
MLAVLTPEPMLARVGDALRVFAQESCGQAGGHSAGTPLAFPWAYLDLNQGPHPYQGGRPCLQNRWKPLWHKGYRFSLSFTISCCFSLSCACGFRAWCVDILARSKLRLSLVSYVREGHPLTSGTRTTERSVTMEPRLRGRSGLFGVAGDVLALVTGTALTVEEPLRQARHW